MSIHCAEPLCAMLFVSFVNPPPSTFRGNKSALPTKLCEACGRPMTWRKRWARTWAEVKYCSDACRAAKGQGQGQAKGPGKGG
jgi:hypothetical protein